MKAESSIERRPGLLRSIVREALEGIAQSRVRSLLTSLGTVLGVAVLIGVLGLTATVSAQISSDFTLETATQVTVNQQPITSEVAQLEFGDNPDVAVKKVDGVESSGLIWQTRAKVTPLLGARQDSSTNVLAVSPGIFQAADATIGQGRLFDQGANIYGFPVAVLGPGAARDLLVHDLSTRPVIRINGQSFLVIGILNDAPRMPELLPNVLIPDQAAVKQFGSPATGSTPRMLLRVRLGAANVVADQVALALRPDNPDVLSAVRPPDPSLVRTKVDANLQQLLLVLAAISLIVGMIGIANTTFVSVVERTSEIGLRRALGARPRDITLQFLCEAAILGLLGGLAGSALATLTVVGVSLANQWTAVIPGNLTTLGPLLGLIVGVLAGTYPAHRAGRIQPIEALRV